MGCLLQSTYNIYIDKRHELDATFVLTKIECSTYDEAIYSIG